MKPKDMIGFAVFGGIVVIAFVTGHLSIKEVAIAAGSFVFGVLFTRKNPKDAEAIASGASRIGAATKAQVDKLKGGKK